MIILTLAFQKLQTSDNNPGAPLIAVYICDKGNLMEITQDQKCWIIWLVLLETLLVEVRFYQH